MAKTIEVKIQQLKESYPKQYEEAYQKWSEHWCSWDDTDVEWLKDDLNSNKWLDVVDVHYCVSYSQGDYAHFSGRVLLDVFLETFDKDNEYFVLREAMKLSDCSSQMFISNSVRGNNPVFEEIEWHGEDVGYGDLADDAVVEADGAVKSVLEGMDYREYYDICNELIGDLYEWVKGKCENMFYDMYKSIRDDLEYQTSEEYFVEWAESMDETYLVEVEDESIGDGSGVESCRLAA